MKTVLLQNYLTTIFGILAGLPTIVLGVFTPGTALALPANYTHILMVIGGVGLVGLGVVSKAFNVHSTTAQVAASQAAVEDNPAAPAMAAEADKQAARPK